MTNAEHVLFTTKLRLLILYKNLRSFIKTTTTDFDEIMNAAREVYKDYPEILDVLKKIK